MCLQELSNLPFILINYSDQLHVVVDSLGHVVLLPHTKQVAHDGVAPLKPHQVLQGCHKVRYLVVHNIADLPVLGRSSVHLFLFFLAGRLFKLLQLFEVILCHLDVCVA